VRLRESIAKIAQPLTYRRAWRRARRLLHPVPMRPLLARIDQGRLRRLQEELASPSENSPALWRHYAKYLEVEKHLRQNIRRAQDLNLHRLPPQNIFDIGCGGGFFLFVCQGLGHRGVGLDVAGIPVFDSLVELLGVQRTTHRINGLEALPDLGERFDLITSYATAFHGGREDHWRWGAKEWDFFLDDLKRRLKPGGRIFFELNAAYGGKYYTPEILQVLHKHGGRIERGQVLFSGAP
jgi:SAM-dependent methyltransferase